MPWHRYSEWTTWSKEEVENYAAEAAGHYMLSDTDADSLRWRMCMKRADASKERHSWQGPRKMDAEMKLLYLKMQRFENESIEATEEQIDRSVWLENQRLNEPYDMPAFDEVSRSFQVTTVGDGLTKRQFIDRTGSYWRREAIYQKYRRSPGDFPRKALDIRRRDIEYAMRELLWRHDYLTPNNDDWLCPEDSSKPYVGLFWYYKEVLQHLHKADRKRKQRMHEEALCLAIDAGSLFREMQIRAAHSEFYLKSEMTRERQAAAGKANKIRDDALAQERWRFYFQTGLTKTEAGWQAAEDLKCSEATIRRAFGGSYPSQ